MEERVVIYPPPPPPPPLEIQTADEVGDTFYDSESIQPKNLPLPPPPQLRFYNNTNADGNSRVDDSENTYVVQIPKNQIYWIPPPEHAQIIENNKKPAQKKKKKQSCCIICLRWTLGIFLVLGLLSCSILALYNLTLCPRPPDFRVMQFTVWHHDKPQWSSSSKLAGNISYDMELEVTNPNGANRIIIRSGKASLLFKGHVIAVGSFPLISQESMGVDEAAVELTGKHSHLPREVMDSLKVKKKKKKRQTVKSNSQHEEHNSSIKEKKKLEMETMNIDIKKGLPLTLKIILPLMWETWLKVLNGDVMVECEVVVNSLASKYPLIVSQNCGLGDS